MTSCILTRAAPTALQQYLLDMFSANVLGGAPIIPESNEWFVCQNDYALAEEFRSFADGMLREMDDAQACADTLIARAAQWGFYPSPGSYATGYVQLTGTAGAALPQDLTAVIGSGSYVRAPYATSATQIGADGTAAVMMRATAPGAAGNNTSGSSAANLLESLDGVNSTLTVLGSGFCNGSDAETTDQFRARFLARKRYRPQGGWDWMATELNDFGCVTRVCRKTGGACSTGRIEAFAMMDGVFTHGLLPAAVNEDLTTWMFGSPQGMGLGKSAIGVFGKFFTATSTTINVSVSGLGCLSAAQLESLRSNINRLFLTLCPEQTLCRRLIEALVVQIAGATCLPTVTFAATDAGASISSAGDAVPASLKLIVPGTVNLTP
jgi:hypothetical protein